MIKVQFGVVLLFVIGAFAKQSSRSTGPNIIVIVTDDLGWNDVSFHGSSEIPTPNIDALAYNGVILNRHYTPPLCTPSRASLMTGKHPINVGMQHHVIESNQPWGLGLDQKLMPEYFREAGYRTRLVGKWHLGFFQKAYTPTKRGFDSHYGYIGPYIDYWDHSLQMSNWWLNKMQFPTVLLLTVLAVVGKLEGTNRSPNVVVIIADDLGWNDVSFHSSKQIFTPNIDVLAYQGVILNRHYSAPLGMPSRAALMTGKHPLNIGMQNSTIEPDQPWGLGLEHKLLPEYFREAGYATQLIGKWNLGFARKDYTPTHRGFDGHFGFLGPYIDYWDHSLQLRNTSTRGLDMRRNMEVDYSVNGSYATDLFNGEAVRLIREHDQTKPLLLVLTHLAPHTGNEDDPMQAPAEEVDKFDYIRDKKRRVLAAMISKVDEGVGQIMQTLKERNMLDNSIVLFYADNGAPTVGIHSNSGSNYPLRGQKYSPWEGAVRTVAAIWSPLLNVTTGRVSNQWIHVSDWLPTLAHAAGIEGIPIGSEIDGRNQWEALRNPNITVRNVVMNNIDELQHYSSYSRDGWKYVDGTSWEGKFDHWLGELGDEDELSEEEYVVRLAGSVVGRMMPLDLDQVARLRRAATVECEVTGQEKSCDPTKTACLFNLLEDPCERNNVASEHVDILEELREEVERYRVAAVEPRNKPGDPRSDPGFHNNTWTWWQDESDNWTNMYQFPLIIIGISIVIVAFLLLLFRPF